MNFLQASLAISIERWQNIVGRVIGKHTEKGMFLLPNESLAELDKLKVFTQKPTVDSMGKALADAGKLVIGKDGKHRQFSEGSTEIGYGVGCCYPMHSML